MRLTDLILEIIECHEKSFVPDPGCEVTGEHQISIEQAAEQICRFHNRLEDAKPLGLLLAEVFHHGDMDEVIEALKTP